jgi:hypothetical protein
MLPTPYIDEQTGKRFYNVRQAAQIVEGVCEATLHRWAKRGSTPFGFELEVQREPVTHHRRSTQAPRSFRQYRMLIPEAKVLALQELLKEILTDHPVRPGPLSKQDLNELEAASRRFRSSLSHIATPSAPLPR